MNSVRLSIRISTRSPKRTPRRLSAPASAVTRRSSSAHVVVCPRYRSAVASGCISACRASWLVQFCLLARYGCSVGDDAAVNGWNSQGCTTLIFDQTLSCCGHTMASAVRGQPPDGGRVNAPARHVHRPRRVVRREQMSDEVAGHLRAAIMSGTLLPGTFIRLDETAAQLGVSITPVREALRTLRGEGMVLLEPHRGHVVAPLEPTATSRTSSGCRPPSPRNSPPPPPSGSPRTGSTSWSGSTTSSQRPSRPVRRKPSPRQSSGSTARSITRRAVSSWPGSSCTWRATCRR